MRLYGGDQVFIPLEYAMEEIQNNVDSKIQEVEAAEGDLTNAQGELSAANERVSSALQGFNSALAAYNSAPKTVEGSDGDDVENPQLEGLKQAMEEAKQAYLTALQEQETKQAAVQEKQNAFDAKKTELQGFQEELSQIQTDYADEKEEYEEQLKVVEEKLGNIETSITETEAALDQAKAQQEAAQSSQEAATALGVTKNEDGTYSLDETKITDETMGAALQGTQIVTVNDDGTKDVTTADGTATTYAKGEDGAYETRGVPTNKEELDAALETAKKLKFGNLSTSDVEFKKAEDGTYQAVSVSGEIGPHGESWETTNIITYDPVTGKTTVKAYNTSDTKEIGDNNWSSTNEYDPETHTKTVESRDGTKYTYIYSDDSLDEKHKTQTSVEKDGKVTNVSNWKDGKVTESCKVDYDKDGNVRSVNVTAADGTTKSLSADEFTQIAKDNNLSGANVDEVMQAIKKGDLTIETVTTHMPASQAGLSNGEMQKLKQEGSLYKDGVTYRLDGDGNLVGTTNVKEGQTFNEYIKYIESADHSTFTEYEYDPNNNMAMTETVKDSQGNVIAVNKAERQADGSYEYTEVTQNGVTTHPKALEEYKKGFNEGYTWDTIHTVLSNTDLTADDYIELFKDPNINIENIAYNNSQRTEFINRMNTVIASISNDPDKLKEFMDAYKASTEKGAICFMDSIQNMQSGSDETDSMKAFVRNVSGTKFNTPLNYAEMDGGHAAVIGEYKGSLSGKSDGQFLLQILKDVDNGTAANKGISKTEMMRLLVEKFGSTDKIIETFRDSGKVCYTDQDNYITQLENLILGAVFEE